MAYNRHPWGYVYEYKCTDPGCYSCERSIEIPVHFGLCYRVEGCPDESMMYDCTTSGFPGWQRMFVQARWENPDCAGPPKEQVGYGCYTRPFGYKKGLCGSGKRNRGTFYKYMCHYGHKLHAEGESTVDATEMNTNINTGIMAVILLFVCIIGVIVGYLIYRRRKKKKSAENDSLLCEIKSADNF